MEPFIGQVELFAFTSPPRGWMPCDGRVLEVKKNTALFSILRDRFGGDGKTTFALPDLKDAAPADCGYFIAVQGVYPPRA